MNIWLKLPGGRRHEATIPMGWVALVGAAVGFAAGLALVFTTPDEGGL